MQQDPVVSTVRGYVHTGRHIRRRIYHLGTQEAYIQGGYPPPTIPGRLSTRHDSLFLHTQGGMLVYTPLYTHPGRHAGLYTPYTQGDMLVYTPRYTHREACWSIHPEVHKGRHTVRDTHLQRAYREAYKREGNLCAKRLSASLGERDPPCAVFSLFRSRF